MYVRVVPGVVGVSPFLTKNYRFYWLIKRIHIWCLFCCHIFGNITSCNCKVTPHTMIPFLQIFLEIPSLLLLFSNPLVSTQRVGVMMTLNPVY